MKIRKMFKKYCPWCNEEITPHQLGIRKQKCKWYRITMNIQVCPYCNNPIKLDAKSMHWLFLMLPLFVYSIIQLVFGKEIFPESPYQEIGCVLAVIGFLRCFFLGKYERVLD